jgi:hypothetical protein
MLPLRKRVAPHAPHLCGYAASGLAADEDEEAALAELDLLIKLLKEAIRAGALAPEPLAPGAGASSAGTPMTWAEGSAVAGELLPSDLVTQIVEFLRSLIKTLTWPVPVVEAGREGAWKTDREFGRQVRGGGRGGGGQGASTRACQTVKMRVVPCQPNACFSPAGAAGCQWAGTALMADAALVCT